MNNTNKILIVTEYFYPGSRPDNYLITEITKTLSKVQGGKIQVICNSELNGEKELSFVAGKITRLTNSKLDKDKILFRIVRFIMSTFKLSLNTIYNLKKNDILFGVTNPAFIIVFFAILKKCIKFKYVLLVYDVFPENLISANILRQKSMMYNLIKKIYDWSYSQADHLIVIGRDMEKLIKNKTLDTVKTSLITNWCDVSLVIPTLKQDNKIIQEFNMEDKIIFSFTGNFGRVQGIQRLLEIASCVKSDKFRLLFIGDGAMLPEIKSHINNSKRNNVIYAGSFPSSEQNIFLNACDVAIVSLSHSMLGLGVPSKSYYNMAARKPILYFGDVSSEIALVIQEHNIGWVIDHDMNVIDVANKIDNMIENQINFQAYGDRARKVVEKNFSKEIIMKQYEDLFLKEKYNDTNF